ncbi:MAG: YceD family protein [Bacteroidia bacterium]
MAGRRDYIIQFAGLGLGKHDYEFEVKDSFFEDLDYSEIKKGNIEIKLELLKQSQMMVLELNIGGTVNVECDLCTGEFDLPINGQYRLIVKVGGHETGDEDDDIITIAANEHELDLSQYIYEYITLSLPIKRVHLPDAEGKNTCDKEVLKKLENFLVEKEENKEEGEEEDKTDPRWNELKNIKLN